MREALRLPGPVLLALLVLASAQSWSETEPEAQISEDVVFGSLARDSVLGDLPQMLERGQIRVLVPYDKTSFFLVDGRPRGFETDLMRGFEESLNEGHGRRDRPISVAFHPVERSRLLPALEEGLGDVVAAGLTITPARQKRFAFTRPYLKGVDEVLVSRLDRPAAGSVQALAGREIRVARDTSYAEHLETLAAELVAEGVEPFQLVEADAAFQSEDLLQMVNGGLIDFTVVDRHKAEVWASVLPNLRIEDLVASEGGDIAWAVRKDSPLLLERLDEYLDAVDEKFPTQFRRHFARYFESTRWVRSEYSVVLSPHVLEMTGYFQRYADRYKIDWLLMLAQGYQESRLDPAAVSPVGALGVMQLLPTTAADMGFDDITPAEPNIHAGIKYMDWIRSRYFDDPDLPTRERVFFALAAYNAGPNRMARLRKNAPEMGLDPNRWFGNMELVTLAHVGMEPVLYVSNIYKYYSAYSLPLFRLEPPSERREQVAFIQERLNALGYPAGTPDGIAGRNTRAAIRAYQDFHGLAVDGRPSVLLVEHLETQALPEPVSSPKPVAGG